MAEAAAQKARFFRSAGVVSAAIALSRVTGLVREVVMARLFGAGAVNDAFQVGFRIPNLTRDLFAEGALSSAFVPTFSQYLATRGKRAAAELCTHVATALLVVVGAVCALGVVFSPELVRLLAPGFEQVPGKFDLAVLLTRIMFPFLLFVALAAQAMGVLNASDRYGVPALASTLFNVGSVSIGVAAAATIGAVSAMDPSWRWPAGWLPGACCNGSGRCRHCGGRGSVGGRTWTGITRGCGRSAG